ncbi:MAG: hypothetical protein JW715_11565 [Sedimentisphaerales bacterium]|nr:hypothetical protein [Sedimentisphaerales bacterium]
MSTKLLILFLVFSTGGNPSTTRLTPPALLPDGLMLESLAGNLNGPDSNDCFFFEPLEDITDKNVIVKAGTKLKLLPSATLEKIIADANQRSISRYRLNVRVTKYKGTNYLYPSYFVPISEPQTSEQTSPDKTAPAKGAPDKTNLNDANDILTMPPDILEKFEAAKARMAKSGQRISDSNGISAGKQNPPASDSALIDRAAILVEQKNGEFILVPDTLGRNVPRVSLILLPCEKLELAELEQSTQPEPMRFKIAGITTKYKNNDYLLLQKATRIHSHGNFGL